MNDKNIRWVIFTLLAIPVLAAVWFCDNLYSLRDQSKLDQCKYQMNSINTAYANYKTEHGGMPPKKLEDIKRYIFGQAQTFECPSGLSDAHYDPPFGGSPSEYVYDYRYLPRAGSDQIICCDHEPHLVRHFVLRFLDHKSRNVLYADGRVVTMLDSDFEGLDPKSKPVPHK